MRSRPVFHQVARVRAHKPAVIQRLCAGVGVHQASVPVILSLEGFNLVPQASSSQAVTDNWQGGVIDKNDTLHCKCVSVRVNVL